MQGKPQKDMNFMDQTTKAMNFTEMSGRDHRISPDSLTQTTDASTVQETTQPMIVQQDTSIRHLPSSNPASGSGIYNSQSNLNISSPPNSSPPQNSQQSQSIVGVTTPTLMVNNPPRQPGPTAGPNQPLQYPTQQFNPQFPQPPSSQVSPLLHQGQPFNRQIPPPYFPQYAPSNSPFMGSEASYLAVIHKQLERQEKQDREHNEEKEIQHSNRVNKSF